MMPRTAADTGTISGWPWIARDNPSPTRRQRSAGDQLPAGRIRRTGANGLYRFEYLLPGEYTIEIEKAGVGAARRTALVEVGRSTQVDFVIGLTSPKR